MEPKPNCVWYETDTKEIQAYFDKNILVSIKQLPEVYLYWS